MLRPNFAMDAPPTSIEIGGFAYPIAVDYRVWLEVIGLMKELIPEASAQAHQEHNIRTFGRIEELVFGGALVDEDPNEVLEAIAKFTGGYPCAPIQPSGDPPSFSFDYDLNEIIIAIRNQSGIDLSYRRTEPFHWWEFLLEFRTLCGDHYITNLMDARSYKGTDKDMLKRKRMCALPAEHSAADQALLDEINAEFSGAV